MAFVQLRVDEENNAEAWWDAARECEWPSAVWPLIHDLSVMEVAVSKKDFASFLAVASKLPGWNDGPRFAPCPIIMREERGEV